MGKGNSKIPPSELKDLALNTHFEEKELQLWYHSFMKDCPDRMLNKEQFVDLYSSFYGSENAKRFASHVYRTFDHNKDGKIDFREFMCSLSVATRGSIEEKLGWAFSIYDIDGDGFISEMEMKAIINSIQKMDRADQQSAGRVLRIFKEMDTNADGKLSLDEFVAGAKRDQILVKIMDIGNLSREDEAE